MRTPVADCSTATRKALACKASLPPCDVDGKEFALLPDMARFLGCLGKAALATVILVQHPAASWAAETTGRGVSGSLYGGGGSLEEPNNEGAPATYDERRVGTGVL